MSEIKNCLKYPRTHHLPWSLGKTNDDKTLLNIDHFLGKEVIVTEKIDGENFSIYRDYMHARSIDSKDHESRHWLKQFCNNFNYEIPNNWKICGENVYAQHSIAYSNLPSYFLMFSIWNDKNICLSWNETEEWAKLLGIELVPILYKGIWDELIIKKCFTGISNVGGLQEGYVIRLAEQFHYNQFDKSIAKFVRENHVQTDKHWIHNQIIINKLKKSRKFPTIF